MFEDIKEAVKDNLNGYFSWSKYVERGKHDHKFGPNKLDYLCQLPIVGILAYFFLLAILYTVIGAFRFVSSPALLIKKVKKEKTRKFSLS